MITKLFIDGRNFLGKIEEVFKTSGVPLPDWKAVDFNKLITPALQNITVDEKIFYLAKIKEHPDTKEKSQELIKERRLLKLYLEQQGFTVTLSGVVRGNFAKDAKGQQILVFKEKGVDVSIAVDMVSNACDKALQTAILASSDSDLQPAIREINKRGVETIYLGFEIQPNKGLTATTKRTILIRNSEVLSAIK